MNKRNNFDNDTDVWIIFVGWPFVLVIAMTVVIIIAHCCDSQKSKGYGGSPGHMSPMEVEELYNKNRK